MSRWIFCSRAVVMETDQNICFAAQNLKSYVSSMVNVSVCGWNGFWARFLYAACLIFSMTTISIGGQIVSDNFSVALGASSVTNPVWTVEGDESGNVSPGLGFALSVDLEGEALSPSGPTFLNKRLGNISGVGVVARAGKFIATISGKYTGPVPSDAANPPNYRIQVNVTAISIYAAALGDGSVSNYMLNFNEVTAGQEQSQEEQSIELRSESFSNLSNYTHLVWAPKSWASTVGEIDQEQGRIFDLTESEPNSAAIDGFEISGNIVLFYDSKK